METVKVKTRYPHYSGYIRGFKFTNGEADVPEKDAEIMVKEFGVELVEAEKETAADKPKRTKRKKAGE